MLVVPGHTNVNLEKRILKNEKNERLCAKYQQKILLICGNLNHRRNHYPSGLTYSETVRLCGTSFINIDQ